MYAALLLLALGLGLRQGRDIPDKRMRNIENTDEILAPIQEQHSQIGGSLRLSFQLENMKCKLYRFIRTDSFDLLFCQQPRSNQDSSSMAQTRRSRCPDWLIGRRRDRRRRTPPSPSPSPSDGSDRARSTNTNWQWPPRRLTA